MNEVSKLFSQRRLAQMAALLALVAIGCGTIAEAATGASASLAWDASANGDVAGYLVYYGTQSHSYSIALDVGTNLSATITALQNGSNYFFSVKSYDSAQVMSDYSDEVSYSVPDSQFLTGRTLLTGGIQHLDFSTGRSFGYYVELGFPWIYHVDMGYEYMFDLNDGKGSVIFYDLATQSYWYSNPSIFPYMYDYGSKGWIYYYPDDNNPGHYTANPRTFYDFNTAQVINE